jgi:hypothetical protein
MKIKTYEQLQERAKELWPDSEHLQNCWLACIDYFRSSHSKRGWILDSPLPKITEEDDK